MTAADSLTFNWFVRSSYVVVANNSCIRRSIESIISSIMIIYGRWSWLRASSGEHLSRNSCSQMQRHRLRSLTSLPSALPSAQCRCRAARWMHHSPAHHSSKPVARKYSCKRILIFRPKSGTIPKPTRMATDSRKGLWNHAWSNEMGGYCVPEVSQGLQQLRPLLWRSAACWGVQETLLTDSLTMHWRCLAVPPLAEVPANYRF